MYHKIADVYRDCRQKASEMPRKKVTCCVVSTGTILQRLDVENATLATLSVLSFWSPTTSIFTKHCLKGYINTRQQSREMGVSRNKNGKLQREDCIIKI